MRPLSARLARIGEESPLPQNIPLLGTATLLYVGFEGSRIVTYGVELSATTPRVAVDHHVAVDRSPLPRRRGFGLLRRGRFVRHTPALREELMWYEQVAFHSDTPNFLETQ